MRASKLTVVGVWQLLSVAGIARIVLSDRQIKS